MARKTKNSPNKAVMGGLLLAGAGVGVYFLSRPRNTQSIVVPVAPKVIPKRKVAPTPTVKRVWRAAAFPLQKGMQGPIIGEMQVALKNISKTGIAFQADGKFGADTESMLKQTGFPAIIDKPTFELIKARGVKSLEPPNETKTQKLLRLGYNTATEIEPARVLNRELTSSIISDSTVKGLLKGNDKALTNIQRAYKVLTNKDLVSDLLSLSLARVRFNEQITRLQALSGLDGTPELRVNGPIVRAIKDTFVKIKGGALHPVKAGTVLGRTLLKKNGIIWFREPNGNIMKVPMHDCSWEKY